MRRRRLLSKQMDGSFVWWSQRWGFFIVSDHLGRQTDGRRTSAHNVVTSLRSQE